MDLILELLHFGLDLVSFLVAFAVQPVESPSHLVQDCCCLLVDQYHHVLVGRVEKNLTDAFIVLKKQLEDKMHTTMFHTDEMMANINAAVHPLPVL